MKYLSWATIVFTLSLVLTSCKYGRFVVYNFADITDYKKFPEIEVTKSDYALPA